MNQKQKRLNVILIADIEQYLIDHGFEQWRIGLYAKFKDLDDNSFEMYFNITNNRLIIYQNKILMYNGTPCRNDEESVKDFINNGLIRFKNIIMEKEFQIIKKEFEE